MRWLDVQVENEDGSLPQWLILIIILCSGFGFVIIMLVLGKIIRILTNSRAPGCSPRPPPLPHV